MKPGWRIDSSICTAGAPWSVSGKTLEASLYSKADGRQRPLGIAALEDKIVQQAV